MLWRCKVRPLSQSDIVLTERARRKRPSPYGYASLTLAEAYRKYIDDQTRAWTANTREAYETSRKLAVALIGEAVPIASISRAQCRDMLDVLRFMPANAGKLFPNLSLREAADRARSSIWADALTERS